MKSADGRRVGVRKVRVDESFAGQRLDNYLLRELKGVPRSAVYRAIRRGEVRINGGRTRQTYRLAAGDEVRIPPLADTPRSGPTRVSEGLAARLEAAVLYEDADLVVLNKPSGLAVHGGSGQSLGLIEALRLARPAAPALELAHRLDKATSGCLIVAKRRPALRALHADFRAGRIAKSYIALVQGTWPASVRRVDAALARRLMPSGERIVQARADGKAARTDFRILGLGAQCSLMDVRLLTGRTHQIRVHAALSGHPLAGDEKYGNSDFNRHMAGLGLSRLFLHASRLELPGIAVDAPLDRSLTDVLDRVGIATPPAEGMAC